MRYIQTHITPKVVSYFSLVRETLSDINSYLDKQLESEQFQNFVIALIISAPFVGAFFFIAIIQLSA